jgi:hypothetical protein
MAKRNIRKFHKRGRKNTENAASIARRSFNHNVRHFRFLHDPTRPRDAAEIERMRAAAKRRPTGNAARLLMELGLDEQGRKAPPRRKKAG